MIRKEREEFNLREEFFPLFRFACFFLYIGILCAPLLARSESIRIACEPSLTQLVQKWGVSSKIPVDVSGKQSSHALREAAALTVDFAVVLGEISPGEKSLLSVRSKTLPSILPVGWEVPRFIARSGSDRGPVSWATFKDVLRGATSGIGNFSNKWRSTRTQAGLRRQFLLPHERETLKIPGYKKLPLEALVLKGVVQGDVEVGLVFSLELANPAMEVLPIEIEDGVVFPEGEEVRQNRYPAARRLQVITCRRLEPDQPASRYASFVTSASGQMILEKSGYLPVGEVSPLHSLTRRISPIDR